MFGIKVSLKPAADRGTTDTRLFELYHDIPGTCFGPDGAGSHAADEYVDLRSLRDVTKVIAAFVLGWCGTES